MLPTSGSLKVVILSFNHPGITQESLRSALGFFIPENIILVHNGSKSNFINELKKEFPEIDHLVIQDNLGFSGGANRGINKAFALGANVVLFMSNDTKLKSFNLGDLKSEFFIGAPRIELRNTGLVSSLGGRVTFFKGQLHHSQEIKKQDFGFYVPGSAFLISHRAWKALKGFDETLGSYWEDVDLSLRAAKSAVDLLVLPTVVLSHGVAKTTGGNPFYSVYCYHRNRRRVVLRHCKPLIKPIFIAYYFSATLGKVFKFLKNRDLYRLKLCLKASFL